MSKKELTDLVKVKYPSHTAYFAYDEKEARFIPLDESYLANRIPNYRSLNEKARKRAVSSYIDGCEILCKVKLPDRFPNVPPKSNSERMSWETASAAVQTLLSVGNIFESPRPGYLLLADLLCGLHCTALRQAEPTFVPAIAVRSDSPEILLALKSLVKATVRLNQWKKKKIKTKISRKAILDYRTSLGELPHHIQDFSEVKCAILKLGKNNRENEATLCAANTANKMDASENRVKGFFANTPPKGAESDPARSSEKELVPIYPDPDEGFQPLSKPLVHRITRATREQMEHLAKERHIPLDIEYWEGVTRSILKQPDSGTAIICPAPAGSGKSTWIQAFLLAIKKMFSSNPELEASIVGITVVLQKVEDLNRLADALNMDCASDNHFMVPLQGWNASGKKRGFCRNAGVEGYEDCPRKRCPYAAQCPILAFREEAPYAPVVGLTQERFYMLREGDLSPILQRMGQDGKSHPRRYILFDEKFQMVPAIALSAEQINDASTAFNDAIQKHGVADTHVRALQQRLNYAVFRPFQNIRIAQRAETGQDIPLGFFGLSEDECQERQTYEEFKNSVLAEKGRFTNKPLSAVFSVMDFLHNGGTALFTKTNGFCIYRIGPPQLHFGNCQTIIFDATAEVDHDYRYLENVEILSGTPKISPRKINIYVHTHHDMNVTKSSMENPWKLSALAEYSAELIKSSVKTVFLCTYKKVTIELAELLKAHLSPSDFSRVLLMPDRDPPTLPYFNGTNGSNHFKDAELVIMLGYPRLDPSTYLSFACAACGQERIARELDDIPEETLLNRNFNPLTLPSVHAYVSHHLAARLEQEIYRCAQRNPGFTGEITIHLFRPPEEVLDILRERIPGEIIFDHELPECVARWKGAIRQYDGKSTS